MLVGLAQYLPYPPLIYFLCGLVCPNIYPSASHFQLLRPSPGAGFMTETQMAQSTFPSLRRCTAS
jgi:hypothetical protein